MNLLKRLLGRGEPASGEIAKDRLRLVLVQDRVNLSAEKMNEMKDELIKVISKYVEIDREGIEIALTQNARQSRLTANIPLVGARQK
jgi:cell division topological specificity factor